MTPRPALILEEDLRIPAEVHAFGEFRQWCQDDGFPEHGRIDYLDGDVEVDLSPEDIYTHGVVKAEIAAGLHALVVKTGLGNVLIDRTRIVSSAAGLSAEPDILAVLWSSLESGRVREIPSAHPVEGRFIEFEGAVDLVVEIVSDRSVRKDRERLPRLYAQAGIPELWLVDARGKELLFEVRSLGPAGYELQPKDTAGWTRSPLLDVRLRLRRHRSRFSRWAYELEHAPSTK